ncbi:MAG: hypothetical protein OEZ11_01955, partial [Gammaproteobacteria bacterium]|nr:hypothetical protein [Gammaproteobacteria bacterium]
WMEPAETGATLRYSALLDGEFQPAVDVVTDAQMFVNWADLPSVTPLTGDRWIAHWLRYSAAKTYSYDVVVSQSHDGGSIWDDAVTAHTDGTQTEHGFVSIAPGADGASLLWLDGRNTPDAAMTLRSAVITPNGDLVQEQEVDDTVCDCCQTDVAIAAGGPVAVYRDRTSDEIRDIYITRFRDGRWQTGERLYADNWEIAGCPVNGPSVVASGDQVAVAWFSAANDKPVVRVMRSVDSGVSFADPVEIASGAIKGYVGLAALAHDSLAVSWVAKGESGDNVLQVRSISASGKPGPVIEVATIHQLRVFPQLAFADGHVWLAWTDDDANQRRLVAARVPVSPL